MGIHTSIHVVPGEAERLELALANASIIAGGLADNC